MDKDILQFISTLDQLHATTKEHLKELIEQRHVQADAFEDFERDLAKMLKADITVLTQGPELTSFILICAGVYLTRLVEEIATSTLED